MVNWPGAIASGGPATGSSSSVHVSAVSRPRLTTRNGRGCSGPAGDSATGAVAIAIEEPQPRPLQTFDHDLRDARDEFPPEQRVALARGPHRAGVECGHTHGDERARVEVPAVRREEPRPPDRLARLDRLDRDRAARRR